MRLTLIKILVPIALFAGLTSSVWASGGDRIPGSRYTSGRGAALGDAYIGLADTVADSLFYNPAGLGKVHDLTIEPLNVQAQSNPQISTGFGSDFYKFQDLSKYESNLIQYQDRGRPGAGFAVLPAFGFRGFGAGLLYQARLMAESDGTNTRYRSNYQLIPSAGYGLRLASGILTVGYVIQWVNQASGDVTVPAGTRPMGWSRGLAEGKGFSHNLGMRLTLPYQYQPTFSLVARNIGGLTLTGKPIMSLSESPSGSIPPEKTSVDASAGVLVKISGGLQLATHVAIRDALNSSETDALRHISAGMEFMAYDRFFLRGGYGSGYPSAGLGLRTSRAEVNFAWFSENIGTGSQASRDIRYLFQFMFRAI